MTIYTRKEVLEMHEAFKTLQAGSFMLPTAVALAKNEKLLAPELLTLQVAASQMKKIEGLAEYDKRYKELCEKGALRNPDGTCQVINNSYVYANAIISDTIKQQVQDLKEEYAPALAQREEYENQLKMILDEKVEYDIPKIKLSKKELEMPENFFSPQQVAPILDLLEF